MRYLLTGVSGYLGGFLLRRLTAEGGHQILSLGRSAPQTESEASSITHCALDLIEIDGWQNAVREFKPEAILHLAAVSSALKCEQNPELAAEINVQFSGMLCDLAVELESYLCAVSTDLVFDGAASCPGGFEETAEPVPHSVYARSKHEMEQKVLGCEALNAAVMRTSIIYGPSLGAGRGGTLSWLDEGLRSLSAVTLYEDEWRTPVYVEDAVTCLLMLCAKRARGIFHCAGPERISRADFGERYARCLKRPASLIKRARRADTDDVPPRPEDVSLSAVKTCEALGIQFRSPDQAFAEMGAEG